LKHDSSVAVVFPRTGYGHTLTILQLLLLRDVRAEIMATTRSRGRIAGPEEPGESSTATDSRPISDPARVEPPEPDDRSVSEGSVGNVHSDRAPTPERSVDEHGYTRSAQQRRLNDPSPSRSARSISPAREDVPTDRIEERLQRMISDALAQNAQSAGRTMTSLQSMVA